MDIGPPLALASHYTRTGGHPLKINMIRDRIRTSIASIRAYRMAAANTTLSMETRIEAGRLLDSAWATLTRVLPLRNAS